MKGSDEGAVGLGVGIEAREVAGEIAPALQPIHARVVVVLTGAGVIGTVRRIGERAKVVVERVILLHQDDDVLDAAKVAIGVHGGGSEKEEYCDGRCR